MIICDHCKGPSVGGNLVRTFTIDVKQPDERLEYPGGDLCEKCIKLFDEALGAFIKSWVEPPEPMVRK